MEEGKDLVELAEERSNILMVGHILSVRGMFWRIMRNGKDFIIRLQKN